MPTLDDVTDLAITVSPLDALLQAVAQHTAPEPSNTDT